jgi:hypothetical protein
VLSPQVLLSVKLRSTGAKRSPGGTPAKIKGKAVKSVGGAMDQAEFLKQALRARFGRAGMGQGAKAAVQSPLNNSFDSDSSFASL